MKDRAIIKKMKLDECAEIIKVTLPNFFQPEELDSFYSPTNLRSLCGRYLVKKSILDHFNSSNFLDIGIYNDEKGKPVITVSGELEELIKQKSANKILCSISHSRNWVASMVVIE